MRFLYDDIYGWSVTWTWNIENRASADERNREAHLFWRICWWFNWQAKVWWIWLCNANEESCVFATPKTTSAFHLKSLPYMEITTQWEEEEKIRLGSPNSSNIIMKQTLNHIWKQRKLDTLLYIYIYIYDTSMVLQLIQLTTA